MNSLLKRTFTLASVSLLAVAALCPAPARAQLGMGKLSEQDEIELGRQAAAEVEKKQPVLRDPVLNKYVDHIGQSLARVSGRPNIAYTFKVIDSADINAFALPGGFIYVNRGLIEAASNESELAGALAHEVNHVVARHSVEQVQRAQMTNTGLSALGAILGGKGMTGQIGTVAAQMVSSGTFMKFSRDAEREADRLGAQTMYDAGYDPHGMITLFEKLEAIQKSKPSSVDKFFASHPSPVEREQNVSAIIKDFPPKSDLRSDGPEFASVKKRLGGSGRGRGAPDTATALAGGSGTGTGHGAGPPGAAGERASAPPPASVAKLMTLPPVKADYAGSARDREIASALSPIFVQGLGDSARFDYITKFDFDGNWRGDDNWKNAEDPKFPLLAYVYYDVKETETHYFVHYAAFHPRDYKGGNTKGSILSDLMQEGTKAGGKWDPTGLSQDAVLAHENDMEGCLVVAEKHGDDPLAARVVTVETLAHNQFLVYAPEDAPHEGLPTVLMRGQHARLFIEPKGHGISALANDESQKKEAVGGTVNYKFSGTAEDPGKRTDGPIGYDLLPIYSTIWLHARSGAPETFGNKYEYQNVTLEALAAGKAGARQVKVGALGAAFLGKVGGQNMARPPWGWFDKDEKDRPLGEWFFDPAAAVKRRLKAGDGFSLVYLHNPTLGVFR